MKTHIKIVHMNEPKRQHYLPAFYLRKFAEDGFLWVYNNHDRSIKKLQPSKTGVLKHFYTGTDANGQPVYSMEHYLAQIEDRAAIALDRLESIDVHGTQEVEAAKVPSERQLGDISVFVSAFIVRVPKFRDALEKDILAMGKAFLMAGFGSAEKAQQTMDELRRRGIDIPTTDAKSLSDVVRSDGMNLRLNRNYVLATIAEWLGDFARALSKLDWIYQKAPTDTCFITSDSPVSIWSPNDLNAKGQPVGGLLEEQVYKICPLGPDTCVSIGWNSSEGFRIEEVPAHIVALTNRIVAYNCERFLFARNQEVLRIAVDEAKEFLDDRR